MSLNGHQKLSPRNVFLLVSPIEQRAVVLICFPQQLLGDLSFCNLNQPAFTGAKEMSRIWHWQREMESLILEVGRESFLQRPLKLTVAIIGTFSFN